MKHFLGATALAVAMVAAPAYATTTFAQFKQVNNTDTVRFTGGVTPTLANVAGAQVLFDYIEPMAPPLDGDILAFMNFSAAGTPYDGTLSFLRVSDNANLLTVTFTDAVLAGGGTTGVFFDAQPGIGTITYTSDFLDFSQTIAEDFSLSFSGLSANFSSAAWTADATGTFAHAVIPEPGTWAMMILGFGGTGALLRRRRASLAVA